MIDSKERNKHERHRSQDAVGKGLTEKKPMQVSNSIYSLSKLNAQKTMLFKPETHNKLFEHRALQEKKEKAYSGQYLIDVDLQAKFASVKEFMTP